MARRRKWTPARWRAEHRMGRNHLAHHAGDAINAVLAAVGYNFRLLICWLKLLLFKILFSFAITLQFNPARNPNSSRPTKTRLVRFCREPCAAALPRRLLLLAPWPRSGAQTIPPDGPRRAAWVQSSADEKAQISEVMPAKSRMHQLSALPIAGIAVAIVDSKLKGKIHFMITSVRLLCSTPL